MPRPRVVLGGGDPCPRSAPRNPRGGSALLYEGGAEGLTIRRLALRCGYTAPAIYAEFGDKAGLLDAILREAIDDLTERVDNLPKHSEPIAQMREQLKEIVRFGREHPTHYRLMEAMTPEQVLPIPNAIETRQRIEAPIEAWRGSSLRSDPETFRQAFWALLHGLISLPASRPDVDWRPELAEVAFDALLAGLMREGESGER